MLKIDTDQIEIGQHIIVTNSTLKYDALVKEVYEDQIVVHTYAYGAFQDLRINCKNIKEVGYGPIYVYVSVKAGKLLPC